MAWSEIPSSSNELITIGMHNEMLAAIAERKNTITISTYDEYVHNDLMLKQPGAAWVAYSAGNPPWAYDIWSAMNALGGQGWCTKSGTGVATTFTMKEFVFWMEEALGAGVTDWPKKTVPIALAEHLNNNRLVLDIISDEWRKHYCWTTFGRCYNTGQNYEEATKAGVQDAFDAATVVTGFAANNWGLNLQYRDYLGSGRYQITGLRDGHISYRVYIGSTPLADAWLLLKITNNEDGGAPEQDLTINVYAGTDEVDITNWNTAGVLAGSETFSGFLDDEIKAIQIDTTKLTTGITNYLRIAGKATVNGELTAETWTSSYKPLRQGHQTMDAGFRLYLYTQHTFDYKAA